MTELLLAYALPVAATTLVFYAARWLYARLDHVLLNPVLIAIAVLIALLKGLGVDYETYNRGGRLISFFLGPAVVALGVPLYLQLATILRRRRAILFAIVAGSVVGILSGALMAAWLGASPEVILSLAPRSVTTPIAIGIAERLGGLPPLSAALVIASGVLGAVIGPALLHAVGIRDRTAVGLALGAAAHGIGTARAVEEGDVEGASSGLAIGLMGVATAVLAPLLTAALMWLLGIG